MADEPVSAARPGHGDEQNQGQQQRDPGQPAAAPDVVWGGGEPRER